MDFRSRQLGRETDTAQPPSDKARNKQGRRPGRNSVSIGRSGAVENSEVRLLALPTIRHRREERYTKLVSRFSLHPEPRPETRNKVVVAIDNKMASMVWG